MRPAESGQPAGWPGSAASLLEGENSGLELADVDGLDDGDSGPDALIAVDWRLPVRCQVGVVQRRPELDEVSRSDLRDPWRKHRVGPVERLQLTMGCG